MILLRLKNLRQTLKPVTLKLMIVSELLIIINFLVNVTLKTGQEKYFIALRAEVDKLDINKLANVPTSLNDLKRKAYDVDVGKLKTVPVDLKKLSHAIDNEVNNNRKFNTLRKVN